jgi:hypothetical protein
MLSILDELKFESDREHGIEKKDEQRFLSDIIKLF